MKLIKKNVLPQLKIWLLQGKTITHNQAQKLWRTNRLAEFVRRLRHVHGMDIDMQKVNVNGEVFGVYRLKKKAKVDRIRSREYMNQA